MTVKIIKVAHWLPMLEDNATNLPTTATSEGETLKVSMPGGFVVPKIFLDRVFAQAKHCLPLLEHGRIYTARKMLGKAFWDRLDDLEHRNAGRCIAHFSSIGLLPLEHVGKRSDNAQEYRLT